MIYEHGPQYNYLSFVLLDGARWPPEGSQIPQDAPWCRSPARGFFISGYHHYISHFALQPLEPSNGCSANSLLLSHNCVVRHAASLLPPSRPFRVPCTHNRHRRKHSRARWAPTASRRQAAPPPQAAPAVSSTPWARNFPLSFLITSPVPGVPAGVEKPPVTAAVGGALAAASPKAGAVIAEIGATSDHAAHGPPRHRATVVEAIRRKAASFTKFLPNGPVGGGTT
ncbi:hypothetical protein C8R45DRAFT_940384 [Mycena sanguinolenta]|nr:hypothetical protein C8R45DRAFT_940384 [Mycena sanguinolenta]